jgi:hypothetical protein
MPTCYFYNPFDHKQIEVMCSSSEPEWCVEAMMMAHGSHFSSDNDKLRYLTRWETDVGALPCKAEECKKLMKSCRQRRLGQLIISNDMMPQPLRGTWPSIKS